MKSSHTKGPWFAAQDCWSVGTVTHNLPTGHIGNICIVQTTGAKTQDEGNANARLIAAAPELLEALKGLVDAYGNDVCNCCDPHIPNHCPCCIARAAIAKAEGNA